MFTFLPFTISALLLAVVIVAADDNPDCALILPDDLLSAAGLATPFILVPQPGTIGTCSQLNADQQAFAQATILNTVTGAIYSYTPLIITNGTRPAIAPVVLGSNIINSNTIIGIWFGSNGNSLQLLPSNYLTTGNTLVPSSLNCVDSGGRDHSLFGQVSFCNHINFYIAANCLIERGLVRVPNPGYGIDGLPCMTTRSFAHVDQDPSDNVVSTYWITADGRTAAYYPLTPQQISNLTVHGVPPEIIQNGSDNRLLDVIVAHNFGCHNYWATPDVTNGIINPLLNISSQPLNELQAAAYALPPIALIPANDEMVMIKDQTVFDLTKVNAYRLGVDQATVPAVGNVEKSDASPYRFCVNIITVQSTRLLFNKQPQYGNTSSIKAISPVAGQSYFAFMAQRLDASIGVLNCNHLFGFDNTIFSGQGPFILQDAQGNALLDPNGQPTIAPSVDASNAVLNTAYIAAIIFSQLEISPLSYASFDHSQITTNPAFLSAPNAACDAECFLGEFTNIAALLGIIPNTGNVCLV